RSPPGSRRPRPGRDSSAAPRRWRTRSRATRTGRTGRPAPAGTARTRRRPGGRAGGTGTGRWSSALRPTGGRRPRGPAGARRASGPVGGRRGPAARHQRDPGSAGRRRGPPGPAARRRRDPGPPTDGLGVGPWGSGVLGEFAVVLLQSLGGGSRFGPAADDLLEGGARGVGEGRGGVVEVGQQGAL